MKCVKTSTAVNADSSRNEAHLVGLHEISGELRHFVLGFAPSPATAAPASPAASPSPASATPRSPIPARRRVLHLHQRLEDRVAEHAPRVFRGAVFQRRFVLEQNHDLNRHSTFNCALKRWH